MNSENTKPPLSFGEFIVLMALMMSLVALSIDSMLPALTDIGHDLGVERANNNQLIISMLLLGLSIGQMIYGPLSDSTGRKPAIYAGFGLFIIGTLVSLFSTTFPIMLTGRLLQGVGAAGPRIVTIALIRDQYEGRAMARVMSFIMAVFILVPAVAPSFGQAVLFVAPWRALFGVFLLMAAIAVTWFAIRQPETLPTDRRRPFSLNRIAMGVREVLTTRTSFGYTIAAGVVFGGFMGYLNSAQQIFQVQYGLGNLFPLFFSVLALAIGGASLVNARLVTQFGMRALSNRALLTISGLSLLFLPVAFLFGGQPPLWLLMGYFVISFFCIGLLFGNLNAMAMEPLGHIAGIGAAVVGSLSTFIAVMLGLVIGQNYNGTVLPIITGFALLGVSSLMVMRWVEGQEQPSGEPVLEESA
ncbi:MAG: multidrug effflux MFS transporter [Anaerolineae bacterium]|nr:multidrug effflux MFS transporter [Anaerolineae bacterium]